MRNLWARRAAALHVVAQQCARIFVVMGALALSTQLSFAVQPHTLFTQSGTHLITPNISGSGFAGQASAMSGDGNTAIVGAYASGSNAGRVWIFLRDGNNWNNETDFAASFPTGATSQFGSSVAISQDGNTVAIGGPGDNSGVGAVWIYVRDTNTHVWSYQQKIIGSLGTAGAQSQGYSVALSGDGNTVIFGGPTNNSFSGAVWFYTRSSGTWSFDTLITQGGNSGLGEGVAISGDGLTAMLGDSGKNIFFSHSSGSWSQQGSLVGGGGIPALAMSYDGNTAVRGDNGTEHTFVFKRTNTTWSQQTSLQGTGASGSAFQGSSVALSADGNTLVIGGPNDNNGIGAFWQFARSGNVWSQSGTGKQAVPTDSVPKNGFLNFGQSVGLSADGNRLIVGAPQHDLASGILGAAWMYTQAPIISSIFPTSGSTNGGDSVTIDGTGLGGVTSVTFGGNAATNVVGTTTSITATVPSSATAGAVDVVVTTAIGSATLTNGYTYIAPPQITDFTNNVAGAFSTHDGPSAGGNTITITGSNLSTVYLVAFGFSGANTFSALDDNTITAEVPSGSAGAVDVTVYTGAGQATAPVQYTYVDPPTVGNVAPAYGSANGGNTVTVTGTNFTSATEVQVTSSGGIVTPLRPGGGKGRNRGERPFASGIVFTVDSDTQLHFAAPANSAGTYDVTVTTDGGTTLAANAYTYFTPPALTSISPNVGPLDGGTAVTITGTDFTPESSVTVGGAGVSSMVVNPTTITFTTPAHAAGNAYVRVTNQGGTSPQQPSAIFAYQAAPTVTAVSPKAGPVAGGTNVALTGTGFNNITGVSFGGTPAASFSRLNATRINAVAPAGSAGAVDITVITAGGTSATSAADQFTYDPVPTLSGLSPSIGPTAGGITVTIAGSNLGDATAVKFGVSPATSFTVNNANSITATAPARNAGNVQVTVTTPGGTTATNANSTFTYQAAPVVTSISPNAGSLGGGNAVITGSGFTNVSEVKFGATTAAFTVVNATSINVFVPSASAGTVHVTVTTAGGTSATSAADQYTYDAVPTLTSLNPAVGPIGGGTSVTITGTGLGDASAVKFGVAAATSFTIDGATQITATAPAHNAGNVQVTVKTPGGTTATSANSTFKYQAAPAISAVSPNSGPLAGGNNVVITGSGFTDVSAVSFGGAAAASFSVSSTTSISAVAPSGSAGTVDVTVTTPGGTSAASASDKYTYAGAPVVNNVVPNGGPTAGGTPVTINGTGFSGASAVWFGAIKVTALTVNSATSITVSTPARAAGTVAVKVVTPGGSGTLTGAFTYFGVPAITGLSPNNDYVTGGTTISIVGQDLAGASAVNIGGSAAGIVSVSSTLLKVTAPAHAQGAVNVTVTTPGGTSSPSSFTYRPAPVATAIYKFKGMNAGGDGANPSGWLVGDDDGNLYGATRFGGASNIGTVFRLNKPANPNDPWTETVLYSFQASDGYSPTAGLFRTADGRLFGMTSGGAVNGYGSVFRLSPPAGGGNGAWMFDQLYAFTTFTFGGVGVVVDDSGVVYGGVTYDAANQHVFRLKPKVHTPWLYANIHDFGTAPDGVGLTGRLLLKNGFLYAVTFAGGSEDCGIAYRLRASTAAANDILLHDFCTVEGDGQNPIAGLTADESGNLFGASQGGASSHGVVYQLSGLSTPTKPMAFKALYNFDASGSTLGFVQIAPDASLYGTGLDHATSSPFVFNLIPPSAGATDWAFRRVHNFVENDPAGESLDGADLLIKDNAIYGVSTAGGDPTCSCGTVYVITGEVQPGAQ